MDPNVAIYRQGRFYYSERPPYFPPVIFDEYPFKDNRVDGRNKAYASLRQVFRLLELDVENFGTPKWNPLGSLIKPGMTVLIKPNLMHHSGDSGDTRGLITHGSLVRVVTDYVYIALKGKGRIIIADGPMDDADFEKILEKTGLDEIKKYYKDRADFNIEIYDLRQERVIKRLGETIKRITLAGDPMGYTAIDLGNASRLEDQGLDCKNLRGPDAGIATFTRHNKSKHEYLISNTFLKADVVISLPKMKTHKRSGVTLALKNMIGITSDRLTLPHSSQEPPYPGRQAPKGIRHKMHGLFYNCTHRILRRLKYRWKYIRGITRNDIDSGNFYGNDVIWRTVLDIFNIAEYGNMDAEIHKIQQRKFFIIVDGIIAGEGQAPTDPDPKPCGVLIAGLNPFCVDIATSRLMGFDPFKIPKFSNIPKGLLSQVWGVDIDRITCASNIREWNKELSGFYGKCLDFKPHYAWKGYIEVDS